MSRIITTCLLSIVVSSLIFLFPTLAQNIFSQEQTYKCPRYWEQFQESCYRFIYNPLRTWDYARRNCQAFQSDLLSINSMEEYRFVHYQLLWNDTQHHKWFTGIKLQNGQWINEDGSPSINLDNALLPESKDYMGGDNIEGDDIGKDYLAYSYYTSNNIQRWGLEKVTNKVQLSYICEGPISIFHNLIDDDRSFQYGYNIDNPLRIPRGPYFKVQPGKKKIFDPLKKRENNFVLLSCLADGYPTPTYEWFKEEYNDLKRYKAIKIDPLTNSNYTISGGTLIIYNPLQNKDAGNYHCTASNKFGTIVSDSVQLLFVYIREFNLKREKEVGDNHWGKVISCDAPDNYADIKYHWSRDYFPNFVEENKRIFVSNDGALYFSALEKVDEGRYSCTLQNVAANTGRHGPFFQLWVHESTSPQQLKFSNNFPKMFPISPIAGEEVRLECLAFGYPIPSYNWTRVGAPLPPKAKMISDNRVLIIPHIRAEDQGEYVCEVRNTESKKNSVFVTILAEPNFTIPLVDKHMDNRADLTWTCEAFGIPDVAYYWLRNGQMLNETLPLQDKDRYTIYDNVLTIQHLDPERDQAMYQCCAVSLRMVRCSSAQLRILSLKPSFKKQPMESEMYAAEGGNVTIVCKPEAAPRPKFIWKKDGNVIGSGGRRRILDTGNLIISPVSRDDEGTYVCTASNEYGSDESRGRLIVLRRPEFIERLPPRIIMSYNQNQTLHCSSYTDELLDVACFWRHNGMNIRDEDLKNNPHWYINNDYLDIINATFAEAGEYECCLKSAVGEISSKMILIVEGPPGPSGGLQVFNVGKTSATLRWNDGALNGRPITMYSISGRTNWNHTWSLIVENITAYEVDRYTGRKEARLEDVLNPYSIYEFRVQAFNEFGYGPPSISSPKHRTKNERPMKAPSNVDGGGGNVGDLTITWNRLSPTDQNAPGIYYKIFWRRLHTREFQSLSLRDYGDIGSYSVGVGRSNYYKEYEVKVQAINDVGEGPISETKIVYSAEDMPQVAPQEVQAVNYNSTSLNVSWIPIQETRDRVRGKLIGHRIKYWKQDNREEDATYYLSRSKRPWSLIVGLQPDTYYFVKVMAYNTAGEGPESERFLERTYRKAPQKPPSSVNVFGVNPSTVRVTWRYVQPSLDEEPLIGYKIRIWEIDQDMSTAKDTIIPGGSKLEANVKDLIPGKIYKLRVLAFSKGGDGRMSSPTHTFQMGDTAVFRSSAENKILDVTLSITFLLFLRVFGFI